MGYIPHLLGKQNLGHKEYEEKILMPVRKSRISSVISFGKFLSGRTRDLGPKLFDCVTRKIQNSCMFCCA